MKILTTAGLTELISKIKTDLATKLSNSDVVSASTIDIDSAPTSASTNLVTSGGVYSELASKVAANTAITGATKTKITYDSKGLVTAGANLEESDIPSLTLTKISDVTATASEVNVLDGITASTTELNYTDGVTSNIQTQLDAKSTVSVASTGTSTDEVNYITVDGTEKKIGGSIPSNIVLYEEGTATEESDRCVHYDRAQSLTNAQKAQAKANIGAGSGGASVALGTIDISATWTGTASPYTQTVTVSGATVTSDSKVDIQPDSTLLAQMISDGVNAMYIANNNGTLTLYAIGNKLSSAASSVQVTVMEVS